MNRNIILVACISVFTFAACLNFENKQRIEYVPLSKYKIDNADIKPDAEVKIIAYSGGKKSEKDNVNYFQFIVINKESGDTLRILAPLICITKEAGVENDTYSTPALFDRSKGVIDAVYEVKDSTQNMIVNLDASPVPGEGDIEAIKKSLTKTVNGKEFVVVNRSIPIFANPAYKTAIGILKFRKTPW
jgi:hypothetical protein